MAGFIKRRVPWTQKPDSPVGIDWSHPLSKGLQAYIGNFPSIRDLVTNAGADSVSGSPVDIVTIEGRSREYTSDSDFFKTTATLDAVTEYTILVFADFINFTTWSYGGIFSKNSDYGTTESFSTWRHDGTGAFNISHTSGNQAVLPALKDELTTGGLFQAVISWDGTDVRTYKDGNLLDTVGYTQVPDTGKGWIKVASNRDAHTSVIDHVVTLVWDRALSNNEIKLLSSNPYQLLQPRSQVIPFSTAAGAGLNEKRMATMGVARPWQRAKFPVATPDEQWRIDVGNAYGNNALTPGAAPTGKLSGSLGLMGVGF